MFHRSYIYIILYILDMGTCHAEIILPASVSVYQLYYMVMNTPNMFECLRFACQFFGHLFRIVSGEDSMLWTTRTTPKNHRTLIQPPLILAAPRCAATGATRRPSHKTRPGCSAVARPGARGQRRGRCEVFTAGRKSQTSGSHAVFYCFVLFFFHVFWPRFSFPLCLVLLPKAEILPNLFLSAL